MNEEVILTDTQEASDLPNDSYEASPDYESVILELNEKICALNEEIEGYKLAAKHQEAIAEQLNEFSELFPEIAVKSVPEEVWESVKRGNSLAASYAVYEKRVTEAAKRIERINAKNASSSAGAIDKHTSQEFFTPDDVRKMSPSEVRANYDKIRRSMEKWN
jgi:isopropylmalate/homocitrate/citramalate synthase